MTTPEPKEHTRLSAGVADLRRFFEDGKGDHDIALRYATVELVALLRYNKDRITDDRESTPPADREIAELREALKECVGALKANGVFHTPIALRRKPTKEWDDYEIDAINRTNAALARATPFVKGDSHE